MNEQDIIAHMQKDLFAKHNNIEIVEVTQGKATVTMQVQKHHLNALGRVHGGALFTLADFAFAAASNSSGIVSVGVNATISYVKSALEGEVLRACAYAISSHPKLSVYRVDVLNQEDEIVATIQSMAYHKKEKIT